MKQMFKLWAMLSFALCAGYMLTACSDDDDDDNGGGGNSKNKKEFAIKDNEGTWQQLTRCGNWRFHYDDNGKLTGIYSSDANWDIDKNFNWENEDGSTCKVTRNGSGYVTKITSDNNIKEEDYSIKEKLNYSYSYNGDGTISKITASYEANATSLYYEDLNYQYKANGTCEFTWRGGNLTQVKVSSKGTEDGEPFTTDEFGTYSYDDEENETQQGLLALMQSWDEGIGYPLEVLGLLGKGSKNFPKSYEYDYSDSDGEDFSGIIKYRYSTNNNGTVSTEYIDGSAYSYSYSELDTRAAFDQAFSNIVPKHNGFLRSRFLKRIGK